ncbi:MAG TPA: four helix bundle protein [Tepidisphaeraceae bacterium]|jgi:four helix bundle protein
MSISRFEDLVAWQKARTFCRNIYLMTSTGRFARDYGLSRQIQRAAVSIMSNIAEGFERNGAGEFHQFLSVSKSSCAEVRSQLYVALDTGYIDEVLFSDLMKQGEELARIIGGLRASVATRRLAERPVPGNAIRRPAQHSALSTQH